MELPKQQDPPKYIFPNFLAKAMAKVDMRTQYEAGMMSMSLILSGIVLSLVYMFIYVEVQWWYKIVLIINGLAGFVFISSFIVTTYQQYVSYMDAIEFQNKIYGDKK